jgi:hypothetical protein
VDTVPAVKVMLAPVPVPVDGNALAWIMLPAGLYVKLPPVLIVTVPALVPLASIVRFAAVGANVLDVLA